LNLTTYSKTLRFRSIFFLEGDIIVTSSESDSLAVELSESSNSENKSFLSLCCLSKSLCLDR